MNLVYITDYLFVHAKNIPDKTFINFKDEDHSFRKVADQVLKASTNINAKIQNNSDQKIIAILLPNSPEFIYAYLGVVHAGHISMPLDPNFKKLEAQNVIDQMQPDLIITDADHIKYFNNLNVVEIDTLLCERAISDSEPLRQDPVKQIVSMLFTSGTTGSPKATPYSHSNHMWNIEAVSKLWDWTSEDTLLISLPLSHWHGLCVGLTGSLMHGNTIYLQERFDPASTILALESGDVSLFMHVPIAYQKLVEHDPDTQFDLSKVRLCISGSSFLPPALWQKFKTRFKQDILERYGASEMGFLSSNTLDSRVPGSVGKILGGVQIKIQKDGEIAMRSPGLFLGYWQNDSATKEHITSDGYWLSGDIGELDVDKNLYLKGRVQEKMKKFGYTVYPRDVEWALMKIPGVREASVMSIQNQDQLSDEFIYFVVGDISEAEILEFSKTEMPNFWRPDRVIFLETIPRMGRANKPDLKKLREIATI
jgi:acyl-CoA synthetase (AMP-forming)/AMP-acid ligase II